VIRPPRQPRARGFTLLETMIALVVIGIAALGALSGLLSAKKEVKESQARVVKAAVADARLQPYALSRDRLISNPPVAKQAWPGPLAALPASATSSGANPWMLDPGGSFFTWDNQGMVVPAATPAGVTKCDDAMPPNILCREVAFTAGLPADGGNPPGGGFAYTLWVRVWRGGERTPGLAYVARTVVVQ
jgi:prepilin-type N-terminal cleavage/methylation domain-containing protein